MSARFPSRLPIRRALASEATRSNFEREGFLHASRCDSGSLCLEGKESFLGDFRFHIRWKSFFLPAAFPGPSKSRRVSRSARRHPPFRIVNILQIVIYLTTILTTINRQQKSVPTSKNLQKVRHPASVDLRRHFRVPF